ncbi:MAG: GNAT family N-acetyltransferase [Candidatus Eisenbacteria sp.]|nr:GNAT family N-acetyltransferase [Candidatus Eisenbacteria bacterium]
MPEDERQHVGPRFIIGAGITLRALTRDDLPHIRRWLDDPELRGLIGATASMTEEGAGKWFERVDSDPSRIWYVIVDDEDDSVIGEAGLLRLFPEWRTTDMTVIVGEKERRGNGRGSEAGRLLLDFAFNYLGLHRVAIGVVGFNEAALSFWRKLGFREEGVQRDGYLHDGVFHDFVMMSVLEDEWREQHGRAVERGGQ